MKKYLTIKNIILSSIVIIIMILSFVFQDKNNKLNGKDNTSSTINLNKIASNIEKETNIDDFFVDIKGAVKKPGVYKFNDNQMIIDAISAANGLTKEATTSNINLSKKLKPEMVVYIFTKKELVKKDVLLIKPCPVCDCKCETIEVNNCVEKEPIIEEEQPQSTQIIENDTILENNPDTALININTADVDELQTLPGIGLTKANAIILYRENNHFTKIEDIKNISGIGDATFENIKNLITV